MKKHCGQKKIGDKSCQSNLAKHIALMFILLDLSYKANPVCVLSIISFQFEKLISGTFFFRIQQ